MKLYETVRAGDSEHTIEIEGDAADVAVIYATINDNISGTLDTTEKNTLQAQIAAVFSHYNPASKLEKIEFSREAIMQFTPAGEARSRPGRKLHVSMVIDSPITE